MLGVSLITLLLLWFDFPSNIISISNNEAAVDVGKPWWLLQKQVWSSSYATHEEQWTLKMFPNSRKQNVPDSPSCGIGSKEIWDDTYFKIHHATTFEHPTNELLIDNVEKIFSEKWENLIKDSSIEYDSFIDYNFAFYVHNLDSFINDWNYYNIEFIRLQWELPEYITDDDNNDKTQFYSIIGHIPKSQVSYELISDTIPTELSENTNNNVNYLISEPRASFKYIKPWNYNYNTYPMSINKAVSDLDINVKWYQTYFSAEIGLQGNGIYHGVKTKYVHLIISHFEEDELNENGDISFEVGFYQRPNEFTFGTSSNSKEFTVKKYEEEMNKVHNSIVTSPFCGFDRWFDNHYEFSFADNSESTDATDDISIGITTAFANGVLQKIQENGEKYRLFEDSGENTYLFYTIEPNGHSIQMVSRFEGVTMPDYIQTWDDDWCEEICTDEQMEIQFGYVFDGLTTSNDDSDNSNYREYSVANEFVVLGKVFSFGIGVMATLVVMFVLVACFGIWFNGCRKATKNGSEYHPFLG